MGLSKLAWAVAALGAGAVFAVGCGKEDAPECAQDADCGAGLICVEQACTTPTVNADPCQPSWNFVRNGDFECGTDGWSRGISAASLSSVEQGAKVGSKALRITTSGSASTYYAVSTETKSVGPGTLCARAWMRGTTPAGHLRIVYANSAGVGQTVSFSSPIEVDEWALVRPSFPLKADVSEKVNVHLRLAVTDAVSGQYLEVDDAKLWLSADGSCSEH